MYYIYWDYLLLVQVYMLTKEEGGRTKPITQAITLLMFSKTWDTPAKIKLSNKEMLMPGEDAKYVIKFFIFN